LENDKGIHISGIGGDVFGVDVSGSDNVIGKNIAVSGTLNVNNEQLSKLSHEYAKSLKDFSTSINELIVNQNIQQLQLVPIQQSINELVKETEGVKPDEELEGIKKVNLKTKFVNVAKNILKVLPKTAETVAAFTPLAPFSILIGEATQSIIEAIQNEI
jgi:hypothetical protein